MFLRGLRSPCKGLFSNVSSSSFPSSSSASLSATFRVPLSSFLSAPSARLHTSPPSSGEVDLSKYELSQVQSMKEELILVDEQDNVVGAQSKKDAHLWSYLSQKSALPHRAFSVLLFNSSGQLCLQRRSLEKITFPNNWANTCCSHPLSVPEEMEVKNHIGVRRAAIRRLAFELGLTGLSEEDLSVVGRILYKSPSDGTWGEFEVDYILVAQKDVQMDPNPLEVAETIWVNRKDVHTFLSSCKAKGQPISPWFQLLASRSLDSIWQAVEQKKVHSIVDLAVKRWLD
eukprot:GILI01015610.1.p1 GENE.GILI01015610.1~~GILI01015610.1.p1  ORF type:complete len:286 (-),score=49.45 GILI01015610.1:307-1164(-)